MTAHDKKNLSAITASLQKIALDLGQADPLAPAAPAAAGSPEEVLELIDNAIEVLEVAQNEIPAEQTQQTPNVGNPAIAKSKSAQDKDDDKDKDKDKDGEQKDAQDDDEDKDKDKDGEQKDAQDDDKDKDEDEEKKEMTARIAILESELLGRQKEAIANDFVTLYPEDVRQAKFNAIIAGKESIEALTAQLKVAKEISTVSQPKPTYVSPGSQQGYLTRRAKLEISLPAWRR